MQLSGQTRSSTRQAGNSSTPSSNEHQQPARRRRVAVRAQGDGADPLMLRAVRGEKVERAPCWMMRQAGR